jgi:hypothetical protein
MPNPELILNFKTDGTVEKETKGFKGKSCEELTKFIEEALGGHDMKRTRKDSYYVQTSSEDKRKKPRLLSGLTN